MPYRLGFVIEQTLGQITHTKNFQHWVAQDPTVIPTWMPISYDLREGLARLPIVGNNWTIRASLLARQQVRAAARTQAFDALFFHTQVTSLFAHRLMLEVPTIVSMDATPLNFDTIGTPYAHAPSRIGVVESTKNALMRRAFTRARGLVVWHQWGKQSLIEDYGAPPEKVAVIAPGVDMETWNFPRHDVDAERVVRLLFVGGDFKRKGGETLLAAMHMGLSQFCALDIVTRDPVDATGIANVRVHHGLGPNMPELMALYARADVFVFPTEADVLPLAIMEAMASGLPVVTTKVGAIGEQITDGVTGFLIAPHDANALYACTLRLVRNRELRREMGMAARAAAERLFNGFKNYTAVLDIMKACADEAKSRA
jgi:glycosyltransferase involved in cell wall biosynthesis